MRIIFFGTPDFVLPIPKTLKEIGELIAVVTNPDRPVGRDQILTPTPVKKWALENNIPVLDPEGLDESFKAQVISCKPDVAILAAYGKIIPQWLIDLFPKGILVVHPSLLPKYRGASPIQAALVSGDSQIGCSIILMDAKMDHGPILSQFDLVVNENSTAGELFYQAFDKASLELKTLLPAWIEGKIEAKEQDHTQATFTTLLKKEHGFIPFEAIQAALEGETLPEPFPIPFVKNLTISYTPLAISQFIRALNPWPGAWTEIVTSNKKQVTSKKEPATCHLLPVTEDKRLKLLKSHLEANKLILETVQLEGKKPQPWSDISKIS